ncbi:MAG: hypothetical protein D4R64_03885 [Porphyromonadaceae bacterium]|nr:MAG: hypothetical protein D4R64_03885 [Porphyromonadaceae bacterium]
MEFSDVVINIHRVVSTIFTVTAIVLLVRSARGWRLKKPYLKQDRNLSAFLLGLLYVQLVAGLLLYFVLDSQRGGAASMTEATRAMSMRFWALEHFIIMMFALLLSQLGWIFISKSKLDRNKHKNTLFYFGTSILLIIITTSIGLILR